MRKVSSLLTLCVAFLSVALPAHAARPKDGAIGFQEAVTPDGHDVVWMHDILLMPIITAISLFVLGLLLWVVFRYNSKSNPEPSDFTHNTTIEILWTVIPVIILVIIAVPSFQYLYKSDRMPAVAPSEIEHIKVTGNTWNWTYTYPETEDGLEEVEFVSVMVPEDELEDKSLVNLDTDYPMVIPVDTEIYLTIVSSDVIHAWTVPAFFKKVDAVPGRTNMLDFRVEKTGVYYGQCSELCGKDHAFMPIEVHVLSKNAYKTWRAAAVADLDNANDLLASLHNDTTQMAAIDTPRAR